MCTTLALCPDVVHYIYLIVHMGPEIVNNRDVNRKHINIDVISFIRASGRFSFHFREVYQKCIEDIGIVLIQMSEILNFGKKWYVLKKN